MRLQHGVVVVHANAIADTIATISLVRFKARSSCRLSARAVCDAQVRCIFLRRAQLHGYVIAVVVTALDHARVRRVAVLITQHTRVRCCARAPAAAVFAFARCRCGAAFARQRLRCCVCAPAFVWSPGSSSASAQRSALEIHRQRYRYSALRAEKEVSSVDVPSSSSSSRPSSSVAHGNMPW